VLASLPGDAVGQGKNNQQNKAQPATQQDYYLIQNQKAITAQVLAFDDASHTVSVRIDFPEWVPNPKYRPNTSAQNNLMRDYQRMMQEQNRLAGSRNPRQMQQHMNNMMNLQNRINMDMMRAMNTNPNNPPFIQKHHLKDFDFEMQENVVYRKKNLPQEYDDTGNIKKYTKEEIAKLRGKNEPKDTYSATADEFHPGQYVWVYLKAPKKASSSSSSSSSTSTKTKQKEDDVVPDDTPPRPTVKTLVIVQEGSLPSSGQTNNRKKKKN
jgi:hypothetical protein